MKDIGFVELAKALRENHSLVKLDLSKNSLSHSVIQELLNSLSENYVISEIIIDAKGKSLPVGFSNSTLMSMYQIFIAREAVFL